MSDLLILILFQRSNVMICFRDIKQPILSAKVFDFTKSTNITEPDNFATTFRDEFYRFGLIVYTALTFRHIERAQCENVTKNPESPLTVSNFQFTSFTRD